MDFNDNKYFEFFPQENCLNFETKVNLQDKNIEDFFNVVYRGFANDINKIAKENTFLSIIDIGYGLKELHLTQNKKAFCRTLTDYPYVKALTLFAKFENKYCDIICAYSPSGCSALAYHTYVHGTTCKEETYDWYININPLDSASIIDMDYEGTTTYDKYACPYLIEFNQFEYYAIINDLLCAVKPKKNLIIDNETLIKVLGYQNAEELCLCENFSTVDEFAFVDCVNLKAVTFPPQVKKVPKNTFLTCKKLEKIIGNISLETITKEKTQSAINGFCYARFKGYKYNKNIINAYEQFIAQSLGSLLSSPKTNVNDLLLYISENMVFEPSDIEKILNSFKSGKSTKKQALIEKLDAFSKENESRYLEAIKNNQKVFKYGLPLTDMKIVVTGNLEYFPEKTKWPKRIKFGKLVKKFGGTLSGTISKSTSLLVCNDINGTSVKLQQAKENKIPIYTEIEFYEMIGYNYKK